MIKSQDIRRFIADKLRNAEFNVISSEFKKAILSRQCSSMYTHHQLQNPEDFWRMTFTV